MLTSILAKLSLLILALLILAQTALAQSSGATTGAVVGIVKDTSGAVIPTANLQIKQLATNQERQIQTDENGNYRFTQLPPGNYQLSAQADGFQPHTETFQLNIGITALLEVILTPANSSELIEVRARATINEGKTESSTNIDQELINNLPINRRNFLDFAMLNARITRDRLPVQGVAATSGLSFNGQSPRGNTFTIDGLSNSDVSSGSSFSTFSQEAVQEFQIVTDSYSAEFGRSTGGVVNIVTRSGSNDLHGTIFLFNRSDELSARNAFAAINPEYKQYQFGATISGPIQRDRNFFFAAFERLSIKQNNIITISDQSVRSARSQGFLLNNGQVPFSTDTTTALARTDFQLSQNDSIWLRYNGGFSYNGALEPFGGLIGETSGSIARLKDNLLAFNNTYINPRLNLVFETRFLVTRREQSNDAIGTDPQVQIVAPEGNIQFGQGGFLPQLTSQRTLQLINNLSLSRGNQQLKFGSDIIVGYSPKNRSTLPIFAAGTAFFGPIDFAALGGVSSFPAFTGLQAFDPNLRTPAQRAFLNFLSGNAPVLFPGFPRNVPLADLALPTFFLQGFGNSSLIVSSINFALFAQDDVKLSRQLLVKLGLRYDTNRVSFIPRNNGNFSPRIALAYNPSRWPNLRLHAGYGIFVGTQVIGIAAFTQSFVRNTITLPAVPFPFSVLPFATPAHRFPISDRVPDNLNIIPQFTQSAKFDPKLRNSYSQQINAGVDYRLSNNNLALEYTFVRGLKLFQVRNINPIVRPIPNNPILSAITGRVDTARGPVLQGETAYDSYYHALTVSLNRQLTERVNLLISYNYSKAIDNLLDLSALIIETNNSLRPGDERSLSLQDTRNHLIISGSWDLSNGKNLLLRNWQLSTIVSLESGHPYNLLAGTDLNFDGDFPPGDRPAGIGRNAGVTPGFANVDLRISREFSVNERVRVKALAEVFNLFNRVNINDINRTFPPDRQGNFQLPPQENGRFIVTPDRFRSAFAPRQFQLGIKLTF